MPSTIGLSSISNDLRSITSVAHKLSGHVSVSLLLVDGGNTHHLARVHITLTGCSREPDWSLVWTPKLVVIFLRVIDA